MLPAIPPAALLLAKTIADFLDSKDKDARWPLLGTAVVLAGLAAAFAVPEVAIAGVPGLPLDTADQAITAIRSMRYPQPRESPHMEPRGLRGFGPAAAAWFWGLSPTEYVRHADLWPLNPAGDLVAFMLIESAEAIRNVDEIAAVPGVTGFFAGPGDLSRSLGVARDAPEVEEAIERIVTACRTHDIACAITASAADMSRRIAQGFRIVGAGRAGGGLPASVDAALRAGRDVR